MSVAAFTQVWTMTVPAGAVTVTDVIPSCARSTLAQPSVCEQTSCAALAAVPNAVTPRALSATVAAAARRTRTGYGAWAVGELLIVASRGIGGCARDQVGVPWAGARRCQSRRIVRYAPNINNTRLRHAMSPGRCAGAQSGRSAHTAPSASTEGPRHPGRRVRI